MSVYMYDDLGCIEIMHGVYSMILFPGMIPEVVRIIRHIGYHPSIITVAVHHVELGGVQLRPERHP